MVGLKFEIREEVLLEIVSQKIENELLTKHGLGKKQNDEGHPKHYLPSSVARIVFTK